MPIKVDVSDILTRKAAGHSLRRIERETGVPRRTIERAITRAHAADVPHVVPIAPPKRKQGPYCWTLESIRAARDEQLRGVFDLPVRLAEATRTDDAIFTAYQARVATQSAIALGWQDVDSDAGRKAGELARKTILLPQQTRESILGTMAYHGLAIGYMRHEVVDYGDAVGPAVAMTLTEWPLEHVRFSLSLDALETRTANMGTVRIVHGDGRWVVFRKFGLAPWAQDAALLPLALLWAAHAEALRDWAGASYAHGQPKILGQLPEGVKLTKEGALTPEADAYLQMLASMVSGDSGAGIAPAGSKTDYLSNGSTAWQVFKELADNRESAAARIFLGTDAILGSRGGAPGVDVAEMFGIATTRIQGDLDALERGFREGAIEPWARLHGIPLADAGWARYELPDIDADKRGEQEAAALTRLNESVKAMKEAGLEVTQAVVDTLRENLGVSVPCNLAATETKTVPLPLAPTDVARVVKVREARASQGLPPVGDDRDEKFIAELEAQGGAPPAMPGAPPTPFTRTVETRAVPEDADGDGKINEAEAEELKKPGPRDGDGDGDVDEEDKRIAKARKKVAKALAKHEKLAAKQQELKASRNAAAAKMDALSNERQISDAITSGQPVPDGGEIKGRIRDLENDVEDADQRVLDIEAQIAEGYDDDGTPEQQAHAEASDRLNEAQSSYDILAEAAEENESLRPELDTAKEALDEAKKAEADARAKVGDTGDDAALERQLESAKADARAKADELKAAKREYRHAEREYDKAGEKLDDFDDGREDLESALGDYRDTHEEVASEHEYDADDAESNADDNRAARIEAAEVAHSNATDALNSATDDLESAQLELEQADGDSVTAKRAAAAEAEAKLAAAQKREASARAEVERVAGEPDPDAVAARARADKSRAAANEAAKLVDDGYGDDDEANAQKTREKAAIITGPKGGRYYVAPSGEKVYVK